MESIFCFLVCGPSLESEALRVGKEMFQMCTSLVFPAVAKMATWTPVASSASFASGDNGGEGKRDTE